MLNWLASTPLGSAAKTFVAVLIGLAVAAWSSDGAITFDAWQTWIIAALVSAIPPVIAWLNPADARWGIGSDKGDQ